MNKNIEPRNDKLERHGLWKVYLPSGQLMYTGHYVNGNEDGYWEKYYRNGKLIYKGNYVNGNRHGYFEEYYNNDNVYYKGYYDMGRKVDYEVNVVTPSKDMFPIY